MTPAKIIAWNTDTREQTGHVELTPDGDILCSSPALHEMVGRWMYVGRWTPEQLMQNISGRRSGFTVYLPEGAPPPWEQPVPGVPPEYGRNRPRLDR